MKTIILSTKYTLFGTFTLALLGMLAISRIPTHAATDTARVVKCAQNDIVPVKAKLRFSTLIILPEKEEILDFTTGDKNFWIINSARNLCYIHPAPVGIRSNLNLITASGHVYSLTEISNDPNAEPDLKKKALACLGSGLPRSWSPQENGARKRRFKKCLTYKLSNSRRVRWCRPGATSSAEQRLKIHRSFRRHAALLEDRRGRMGL